jgi:transposase
MVSLKKKTERIQEKEVVTLTQKQQIILKHLDGISNRSIAAEMHVSKDTVNKYVNEYEQHRSRILSENPNADPNELIRNIVEKPRYNTSNRSRTKVTAEMIEEIENCLKTNEQRRASGMSKQQMKKIDIYEYLNKTGDEISYATVKSLIRDKENIARGNEKGHVERSVEYIRKKVFCEPGKDVFDTLAGETRGFKILVLSYLFYFSITCCSSMTIIFCTPPPTATEAKIKGVIKICSRKTVKRYICESDMESTLHQFHPSRIFSLHQTGFRRSAVKMTSRLHC